MRKDNNKIQVSCVGMSGGEVTGSCYLIECPTGEKILLDAGLYQNNDPYKSWKINKQKFSFKPKEIDYIFISHLNIDHIGMLPRIIREGFNGQVFISYESVEFIKPMLEDSAKIMERDILNFNRKYKKEHSPIYDFEDVEKTLSYIRGAASQEIIKLNENISIRFIPAGHIFGSCQIELFIKLPSGNVKKISYSGDLGNIIFPQPFVENFSPIIKTNMFIGECTYNDPNRSVKKDQRQKDLNLLKSIINETCIENKGTVLIPTFALQRTETILFTLWSLFKNDENFKIPIVVDSPLGVNILHCFNYSLTNEDKEIFKQILNWKNLKIINSIEDSKVCVADETPKIVCSSSGMLTQGRSILYLKSILPKENCSIITCGYMAEGTLGYKIKNESGQKNIMIDQKAYPNKAKIFTLKSFSSHMQYTELLKYYTDISNNGCEIIWLVHGDENKINFKKDLETQIHKIDKTTKVVATNYDTVARI